MIYKRSLALVIGFILCVIWVTLGRAMEWRDDAVITPIILVIGITMYLVGWYDAKVNDQQLVKAIKKELEDIKKHL